MNFSETMKLLIDRKRVDKRMVSAHPASYYACIELDAVCKRDSVCTDAGILAFAFRVDHLDIVEVDSPRLYQQAVLELTASM